ncbi:hypothetical protein [Luteolibacter marinus]|uniref:hypothetical protein n=1 Tax=Luteolibacter marinus TaxID=2776705 RepID=UPI001865C742|nr:hypothetical protein [Luteolibacter marinus]
MVREVGIFANVKEKSRPIRRAEAAEDLNRRLLSIIDDLDKIPKFKGKAGFMRKVFRAHTRSHNLAWDLRYDADEEADRQASGRAIIR